MATEPLVETRRTSGVLRWARSALRLDAEERGVGGGLAELLFVIPAIGAIIVAIAALNGDAFNFLVDEDSLLEWLQVPGFFAGAVLGVALALRAHGQGNVRRALGYGLFAAACFFVAGEEVSWGQRIFGFGTPETIEELNNQDEVTVHNLTQVRVLFKFFLIGLGLAGAVVPWALWARRSSLRRLAPPLFTTSTFLLVFGYNAARLVFFPDGFFGWEESFIVGKYGEWPETCLAAVVAVYAWLQWRNDP